MTQDNKRINWSERCWKEMLIYQRKCLWLEDTVKKLAAWMRLKPGMTAIDVGCGLGYLGYTYWSYFGEGGRYFGVDISPELARDAEKAAKEWAKGGEASFIVGDAYKLPLPDDSADIVMCHILLIHLKTPEIALAEMLRVAKRGGIIICKEPDNLSTLLTIRYPSVREFDIEEQLLFAKVAITCNRGRIKIGQGDNSLGPKIPRMMKKLGLTDIGVRINDRAYYLEPPYQSPLQQYHLEWVKEKWLDEKRYETLRGREEREFLAGGGDSEEYNRYREICDKIKSVIRRQIEDGQYFACGSGDLYVIKAKKP